MKKTARTNRPVRNLVAKRTARAVLGGDEKKAVQEVKNQLFQDARRRNEETSRT